MLSVQEFSAKIKAKFPQYQNMDDATLAQKIVAKHPEYQSQVNLDPSNVPSPMQVPEAKAFLQQKAMETLMPTPVGMGMRALEWTGKALAGAAEATIGGLKMAGEAGEDIATALNLGVARSGGKGVFGNEVAPATPEEIARANPYDISKKLIGGASQAVKGAAGAAFAPVTGMLGGIGGETAVNAAGAVMQAPFSAQGNAIKGIAGIFGLKPEDAQAFIVDPLEATETALMAAYPVQTGKIMSKVAKPVVGAGVKAAQAIGKAGKAVAKSSIEAATNIPKLGIETAIKEGEAGVKAGGVDLLKEGEKAGIEATRQKTFEMIKKPIDMKISELAGKGKAYEGIRTAQNRVVVRDWLKGKVEEAGLKIGEDGKISATPNSKVRASGDLSKIQSIYDMYGDKTSLTNNELMNLRDDLTEMSKFDATKTSELQAFAKGTRNAFNKEVRPNIEGLEALDKSYTDQITELKKIKNLVYDKSGKIKDNAVSLINNLMNKGKEGQLARLKDVMPDLEEFARQVKVTKALEGIEAARINKIGGYGKNVLRGGLAVTGNWLGLAIEEIASHPNIVVPLLRSFGKAMGIGKEFAAKVGNKIMNGEAPTGMEKTFVEEALKQADPATVHKTIQSEVLVDNFLKEQVPKLPADQQAMVQQLPKETLTAIVSKTRAFNDWVATREGKMINPESAATPSKAPWAKPAEDAIPAGTALESPSVKDFTKYGKKAPELDIKGTDDMKLITDKKTGSVVGVKKRNDGVKIFNQKP